MSRLSDTQWEFLQDVAELIIYAETRGYKLTGGELKRPIEMQLLYYYGFLLEVLRNVLHLVPGTKRTKTLQSDHLKGLAIDFNIFFDHDGDGDKDYTGSLSNAVDICRDLGEYWKYLHPDNYWGGDWGWDTPHFGRKFNG